MNEKSEKRNDNQILSDKKHHFFRLAQTKVEN